MFYRLNFPASTFFGPSRVARPFSPTIVEWMLSLWLCSRQRRPVIRGDSIFPVHPPHYRPSSHYYKVTNEPRKRPADHPISLFLSLSLSFSRVRPLSCIFSFSFPSSPFYFTSVLSVSLPLYGPNRFSSQLAIAN